MLRKVLRCLCWVQLRWKFRKMPKKLREDYIHLGLTFFDYNL